MTCHWVNICLWGANVYCQAVFPWSYTMDAYWHGDSLLIFRFICPGGWVSKVCGCIFQKLNLLNNSSKKKWTQDWSWGNLKLKPLSIKYTFNLNFTFLLSLLKVRIWQLLGITCITSSFIFEQWILIVTFHCVKCFFQDPQRKFHLYQPCLY